MCPRNGLHQFQRPPSSGDGLLGVIWRPIGIKPPLRPALFFSFSVFKTKDYWVRKCMLWFWIAKRAYISMFFTARQLYIQMKPSTFHSGETFSYLTLWEKNNDAQYALKHLFWNRHPTVVKLRHMHGFRQIIISFKYTPSLYS